MLFDMKWVGPAFVTLLCDQMSRMETTLKKNPRSLSQRILILQSHTLIASFMFLNSQLSNIGLSALETFHF